LQFTAESLSGQVKKAQKDENAERTRLKKALRCNNDDARIYASNAIRKKRKVLNLLRLASRIETVATMRQVAGNMTGLVKGMDKATETTNLERISVVMDKFESQFSDLNVQTSYIEDAMGSTTTVSTPRDLVDSMVRQMAEEANIELQLDLATNEVPDIALPERVSIIEGGNLADRLRSLRPAT
ncbi:vacuolar assembly protein DID2, partial [Lactarius psammicola]